MAIPLADGKILGSVILTTSGLPPETQSAAIVLVDATGKTRAYTEIGKYVPATFKWNPSAARDLTPGKYGLALEVLVQDGDHLAGWRTVPIAVDLAAGGLALLPLGDPDRHTRATLFDPNGAPTDNTLEGLQKTAVAVKAQKDIAVVTIHDGGPGDAQKRTELAADQVRAALVGFGAQADRLLVFGVGNQVADFKGNRDVLGPHRIEVRYRALNTGSLSGGSTKRFDTPAGLWVDDKQIAGASDKLPNKVEVRQGEATRVVLQKADGTASVWQRVFANPPSGEAQAKSPQGSTADWSDFGAEILDAVAAQNKAFEAAAERPAAAKPADAAKPAGLAQGPTAALDDTANVEAAELQVYLPKAGLELGAAQLPVRGRTLPGNKLTIQGQEIPVASDGSFYTLLTLPNGKSKLEVTSTDAAGNKAVIERPLAVKERSLFLLAIADTSLSQVGAHLKETEQFGGYQAGKVQLFGRGAVYAKGRISGEFLGLKDLQFTAHLDTAKDANLTDFATNLLDPTRFYPVYGDSGGLVQDAQSRGKMYILVEADRSKFLLGNLKANIQGIELLRYSRALYGMQLDATRVFGKDFETRVQGFVASPDKAIVKRTDVLRGTGGSLYYLSARDLVDGSEQVNLIIRDRISGLELARLPQTRNVDYTVDPFQGRIVFKSPVSSAADAGLLLSQNGLPGQANLWAGHPIFVEAVYEARGVVSTDQASFALQLQEKMLGGKVSVGAAYVQEGRDGAPKYQLAGADVKFKIAKGSQATVEYAYSQSRDTMLSVSDDGGLSFGTPNYATSTYSNGAPVSGQAIKIATEIDLRDVVGLPDGVTSSDAPSPGRIRAHYQWMQAGFQSGGSVAQQGQQKIGLDALLNVHTGNTLNLRYDGISSDGPVSQFSGPGLGGLWGTSPTNTSLNPQTASSGSFSTYNQQTIALQDSQKLDARWTMLGGATFGYGMDSAGLGHKNTTVGAGAAYRATERLTLRGDQQAILFGDPQQFRNSADHLLSTVGLDYKLNKTFALTLTEKLGWGGQNATAAGIRTELDKDTNAYVQQRLEDTYQTGRLASATVVGAESRYGTDKLSRAYGEYQIDALNAGAMNRAVMGVGKRFEIMKGVNVDAGYERQQTFSGASGPGSRDALSLGGEWLRNEWLKFTTRQEVRLDQADPNQGGLRKLQVLSLNNGQAGITKELTLFGRANYMRTQNQTSDQLEAEALEATFGAAFRPIRTNWLHVVGKYSHLIEMRPSNSNTGEQDRAVKDILSVEPIAELPYRLQLSEKLAFRRVTDSWVSAGVYTPATTSDTFLLINRLGWHAMANWDIFAEYRILTTLLTHDAQQGVLLETAYTFAKAMRVGLGYNFTRFVETPSGDIRQTTDLDGFFVRMIGMY